MNTDEIAQHVANYSTLYPTIITVAQAAEIAGVPEKTIYAWSSMGLLDAFKAKRGRHVRLGRDALVRFLLSDNESAA